MLGRALIGILFLTCIASFPALSEVTGDPQPQTLSTDVAPTNSSSTTSTSLPTSALNSSPEPISSDWLPQSIQLFSKGSFTEAEKILLNVIAQRPNESVAYYNLGLVEFKLNRPGLAMGRWRQALDRQNHFPHAREALRYARAQVPSIENSDFSPLWWAHLSPLADVNSNFVFLAEAVLMLWAGILLIRRLKLLKDSATAPRARLRSLLIASLLLALTTTLVALKVWDRTTSWATISSKRANAHTTSSEDSATLFEVSEGQEVIVLRAENGWAEVQMPSEKTGWIAAASLTLSAGE
jgi:tetratricopeptide (TPR) repeat protein